MKKFFLFIVVPLCVASILLYSYLSGGRYITTENAYLRTEIAMVSAGSSGYIDRVLVKENDHVEAGQLLFVLDLAPFNIEVNQATALLEDARHHVQILKATYQRQAIPDRPGNNRADTFTNILENPRIGLMFVVANRREVVRVSGSAQIVKDEDLLEVLAIKGKAPKFAIIVRVEEAMFHCGKSMIRSNLWNPEKWESVEGLPSYGQALIDHGKLSISVKDMQNGVEQSAIDSLY